MKGWLVVAAGDGLGHRAAPDEGRPVGNDLAGPVPLPAIAGQEGAGVIETIGSDVRDLKPGDRVAYTSLPGSYSALRLAPADRLVKLPEGISDIQAAAMMLKGLTVHYLIFATHAVNS